MNAMGWRFFVGFTQLVSTRSAAAKANPRRLNRLPPVSWRLFSSEPSVEAVGIDEQFGLVVRTADGTEKTVRSGEVSVRGMYGYVE